MSLKTLCVVRNKASAISESFIDRQLERFPYTTMVVFGADVPRWQLTDGQVSPLSSKGVSLSRDEQLQVFSTWLRDNHVDVVLAHFGHIGSAVLPACQVANVPLVTHFHGYDAYQETLLNEHRQSYRALFESRSRCIVPSAHMRQQLVILGASPECIDINPYGVEIPETAAPLDPTGDLRVLSVGRFVDKKAPHLTVLAFSEIAKRSPQCFLDMVGEGYLLESSKVLAEAVGINHQIRFHGGLPNSEVLKFYEAGPTFLHNATSTAYGDREGLPVAILEAMAYGLPIVATNHTGIPEAIVHGKNGLLVEERSISGIVDSVLQLQADRNLALRLGRAGRETAIARFSIETSIENLLNILERSAESDRK